MSAPAALCSPQGLVARKLPDHPATLDDLFAIAEDERHHEIIDGELIEKGAASGEHGGVQADLVTVLNGRFGRRPGGRWPGGWWFATAVEIHLDRGHLYRPDVVGWRRERVPQRPTGVPISTLSDWICEILSTNRSNDLVRWVGRLVQMQERLALAYMLLLLFQR